MTQEQQTEVNAERVDWMPEARQLAAQCWCDAETEHIEMNPVLAEAVARRIAAWMDTGAFHARNEAYWRERTEKAEADRAALLALLKRYRNETPLGHQPHMIAHVVDEAIARVEN